MDNLTPVSNKESVKKLQRVFHISKSMRSLFPRTNPPPLGHSDASQIEPDKVSVLHPNDTSRFSSVPKERVATPQRHRELKQPLSLRPDRQNFLNASNNQSIHSILNEFESEAKNEEIQEYNQEEDFNKTPRPNAALSQENKKIRLPIMPHSLDTSPVKSHFHNRSLSPLRMTSSFYSQTERTIRPKSPKELVFTAYRTKIKSYPSNSLILQEKMRKLKEKLDNNEDINPHEYREVEAMVDKITQQTEVVEVPEEYIVYAYSDQEYECSPWHPTARESPTMSRIGNHIVLYGGNYPSVKEELVIFEIKKNRWFIPRVSGDAPIYQDRFGHSACVLGEQLYIFGGEKVVERPEEFRPFLNDIVVFNTRDFSYSSLSYKCFNGKFIEPRKYHAAAITAQKFYVYGGIDAKSKCYSDLWELDLRTPWQLCRVVSYHFSLK